MNGEATPISVPPETHPSFRRGQLLVLLEQLTKPIAIERLGYVEFFAANPFLIWRSDSPERTQLRLAGLAPGALSYQATTERYANRRTRLRSDLGALAGWGYLNQGTTDGYLECGLTPFGREAAQSLHSLYADAYRLSVTTVLARMRNLSNHKLNQLVQQWLNLGEMRIDLLDADTALDRELQGRLL